jgi:uncharacterized membrane protein YedE/YeeE
MSDWEFVEVEDVAHSLYCFSLLAVSAALRSWLKYSLLLVIASSNLILIFRYFFLMSGMLVELWAVCWFARRRYGHSERRRNP